MELMDAEKSIDIKSNDSLEKNHPLCLRVIEANYLEIDETFDSSVEACKLMSYGEEFMSIGLKYVKLEIDLRGLTLILDFLDPLKVFALKIIPKLSDLFM